MVRARLGSRSRRDALPGPARRAVGRDLAIRARAGRAPPERVRRSLLRRPGGRGLWGARAPRLRGLARRADGSGTVAGPRAVANDRVEQRIGSGRAARLPERAAPRRAGEDDRRRTRSGAHGRRGCVGRVRARDRRRERRRPRRQSGGGERQRLRAAPERPPRRRRGPHRVHGHLERPRQLSPAPGERRRSQRCGCPLRPRRRRPAHARSGDRRARARARHHHPPQVLAPGV
jgi:hypothetical protein